MCVDIIYTYDCGDHEIDQYICLQNLDGPRYSEQCPNWGGIEYEKKDGQCNKCLMYPIPDHQPETGDDEIFPRSPQHGAHRPAGHEFGAGEQWTPQLGVLEHGTQQQTSPQKPAEQQGIEQRPRSQHGSRSPVQRGTPARTSGHSAKKFSRKPRRSRDEQVQTHTHWTTEEQAQDGRRSWLCNIL